MLKLTSRPLAALPPNPRTDDLHRLLGLYEFSLKKGPWIAGGAIRRSLSNAPRRADLDVFFSSGHQAATFVAAFSRFAPVIHRTPNATTFLLERGTQPFLVQAVTAHLCPTVSALLGSFDFSICQFAADGNSYVTTSQALADLKVRRLRLLSVTYPTATLRRLIKYGIEGYFAPSDTLKQLMAQVAASPALQATMKAEPDIDEISPSVFDHIPPVSTENPSDPLLPDLK